MTTEKIKVLVEKYMQGETTLDEEQQLRVYFRDNNTPDELQPYADQFYAYEKAGKANSEFDPFGKINFKRKTEMPPSEGRRRSKALATGRKKRQHRRGMLIDTRWVMRIAAGILLLVIGFAAGWYLQRATSLNNNHRPGKIDSQASEQKTIQNPAHAFATTKKALKIVAANLNTGNKEIRKLAVFNEAQKKVAGKKSFKY